MPQGWSKSVWIQELTWEDVAEYLELDDAVIVPIGSTEVHGPHLPVGVDAYEAIDYAEEIGRRAGVLLTPPIWFGDCSWHMGKPGTIALQPETLVALLKDVYTSLIEHGFKTIISYNGHRLANQPAIGMASRSVGRYRNDVSFFSMDPLWMVKAHLDIREGWGKGNHGDEYETSHMMFKHPELVKEEKFVFAHGVYMETRFLPIDVLLGGDKAQFWHNQEDENRVSPAGHIGDPHLASSEKGERLFELVVEGGVEFVDDIRRWQAAGKPVRGALGGDAVALLRQEMAYRRGKGAPTPELAGE